MTLRPLPELTESFGVPVYEDERVPLWWNGGMLMVPPDTDPKPLLEALSGSQPDPDTAA